MGFETSEDAAGASATAELVRCMVHYQQGSLEAFDRLYALLAPGLRPYLARRAWPHVAELDDLLQETFLQIHRARHTYLPPRPVEPWAFGIARNVILMSRRAGRRRAARETAAELPPEPAARGALEDALARREQLERALGQTTKARRGALLLHYLWGFSFREVGRLLSIRAAAAKLRASRGRADLRAILDREEDDDDR